MNSLTAHRLCYLTCLAESIRFRRSLCEVAGAQERLLMRLVRRNAATRFGRRHQFDKIRSVAEYQSRVPISTYEDYADAVRRIGEGQREVLTRDDVLLLEPTSGSTAATKFIPYTEGLKAEFQRAAAAWMIDLYNHYPGLMSGQTYWSLTPVSSRNRRTPAGTQIGFEEDCEYFGPIRRRLIQSVMAVPSLVRLIDDVEAFRYVTLLFLLRSRSLSLISVWNPTFLMLLVERLPQWWAQLSEDVASGSLTPPAPMADDLHAKLSSLNMPDRKRAGEIISAFRSSDEPGEVHSLLWPRLQLVSCWADAHSAMYAAELATLFPQARIQPKGLIATEGFVSFPLTGMDGSALAVRSHFFEFIPADGQSRTYPLLAHELKPGRFYEVILTTGGGLYRYRLHDRIEVRGLLGACPLIRFAGKEAHISDHFGEKLNERHVRLSLDDLLSRYQVRPAFAMVACETEEERPAYTLFIESPDLPDADLLRLVSELEAQLQENFHYRYCRDLGQLDRLRVFRILGGGREAYLSACRSKGQRIGDIKPTALDQRTGWAESFRGWLLLA